MFNNFLFAIQTSFCAILKKLSVYFYFLSQLKVGEREITRTEPNLRSETTAWCKHQAQWLFLGKLTKICVQSLGYKKKLNAGVTHHDTSEGLINSVIIWDGKKFFFYLELIFRFSIV